MLTTARPHNRPPARRRLQHYNNPVFVENLVNKLKHDFDDFVNIHVSWTYDCGTL